MAHHIVLATMKDVALFIEMSKHPISNLENIIRLDIHDDAAKMDEFAEDQLALVLKELNPRPDGNPHRLDTISFILKGTILFTRHSYHLASPAMSPFVIETPGQTRGWSLE